MKLRRNLVIMLFSLVCFVTLPVMAKHTNYNVLKTLNSSTSKSVTPILIHLSEFRDKHKILLEYIQGLPSTMPYEEREALYNLGYDKIKKDFRNLRKKEYKAVQEIVTTSHSCTDKSPGTKRCGFKWVYAPSNDFYTRAEWVRFEGQYSRKAVFSNKAGVYVKSANGRKKASVTATFKLSSKAIDRRVETDLRFLISSINRKVS